MTETTAPATHVLTMHPRGKTIRVEVPSTVGPLGAYRGQAAAERSLASWADCVTDEVIDQRVERYTDLDGSGSYWLSLFEYNRSVAR